jgi:general secretion pathway protein L
MANLAAELRQRARAYAQRAGLPAFLHWWGGQLAPFVPAGVRAALRQRLLRPVIAFAQDAAVVWVPRRANGSVAYVATARIPLKGEPAAVQQAGRAAIAALPRIASGGGAAAARVAVALPAGQVMRKELRLPEAVEPDLKQALTYDLDRHTPFRPEELEFDAAVVGRDPVRGEIRVDWAAARSAAVSDATRRAEDWGATVVAVTPEVPGPEGPAVAGGRRLNLLSPALRLPLPWWRRWRLWAPLLAVGILLAAAIVVPVWQKRAYAIELSREEGQARVQADAASALRAQLEAMTEDYNHVLARKYGFPPLVQVLDDVSKVMPDDTWLTQFEVKSAPRGKEPRREVVLRGESANAGRLVSLLEETKVFVEAAPRSVTTKIQPGPGEIFDLGALLAPIPVPAPITLATAAGEPPAAAPAPAGAPTPAPAPQAAAPAVTPAANPPAAGTAPPVATPAYAPPPAFVPQVAQPAAPPGMTVPRDVPPPPGSVAPPSSAGPPTTTVGGQTVVSGTVPGAPAARSAP